MTQHNYHFTKKTKTKQVNHFFILGSQKTVHGYCSAVVTISNNA